MLCMELKAGEKVRIGTVFVTLEHKSGSKARLSITTDNDVPIEHIKGTAKENSGGVDKLFMPPVENAFVIK